MAYWYYINGTKSTRSFAHALDCIEAIPSVHIERGAEVALFDDRPNVVFPYSVVTRAGDRLLIPGQTERPATVKGIDPIMFNIYYRDVTPGPEDDDEPEEDCGEIFGDYHCEDFNEVYRMVQEWGQGHWADSVVTLNTSLTADQGVADYTTGRRRHTDIFAVNERSLRYLKKAAKAWGVK